MKNLSLVILIFMCALTYLSDQPVLFFWSYLNFLTMLVHIGLIVSPVPASVHEMMVKFFPWVSLTSIDINSMFEDLEFSIAPAYNSAFWQLGYRTKNAAQNAGSINTFIVLPFMFTVLFFIFKALGRVQKLKFFQLYFMKRDTIFAMWIRTFLQLFFPMFLISLQMDLSTSSNENYPATVFLDSGLNGDSCSGVFRYYTYIVMITAFFSLTAYMALQNIKYANLYKAERMSVYAGDLLFAYKSTKQDIMAREREKHADTHDQKWWNR